MSFAREFRVVHVALALVLAAAAALPGPVAAHRVRKSDPYPTFREPREGLHLLKDVYNEAARHEQGEVHETFMRMSRDAVSYFKGALVVFYHDLFDAHRPWSREPVGPTARLLGDSHAQNLGTVRDGRGVLVYDWIRYDHAVRGPVMADVRRLLVSLVLLADEIAADVPDLDLLLKETVHAYRASVLELSKDPSTAREAAIPMERATPFVRRMLLQASRTIRTDLLARWTVMTSQGRRFRTQGDFLPLSPDHRDAFEHALSHLPPGRPPRFLAVKDATRRVYAGKGCRGHERIYLLVEGPTSGPDDDLILEVSMKPMPSLAHFYKDAGPAVADQSQRVIDVARALSRSPEPYLGRIAIGEDPYVIEEVQPWETLLSTESLESASDLFDLARSSAYLLARAHVLTVDRPEKLISFVWGWARRGNVVEKALMAFAKTYADQMHAEYAVFKAHIDAKPLLVVPEAKGRHHLRHRRAAEPVARPPVAAPPSPAPSPAGR